VHKHFDLIFSQSVDGQLLTSGFVRVLYFLPSQLISVSFFVDRRRDGITTFSSADGIVMHNDLRDAPEILVVFVSIDPVSVVAVLLM
jgi:hypothetical protein